MAINLKSTSAIASEGVNILVYGLAGSGKTSLIKTMQDVIVLSAEGGLLSISDSDIPYIEINSIDDLKEAYSWLIDSEDAAKFKTIAIDSISEVAEVCLSHEKAISKDGRAAYGNMQDEMAQIIRAFRDIPNRNVFMTAKCEKAQDEMGRLLYSPSMPGNKSGQQLPYFFDEVLALRVEKDADGNTQRALMCDSDGVWAAKDRSGILDSWESPDLGEIIKKIGG